MSADPLVALVATAFRSSSTVPDNHATQPLGSSAKLLRSRRLSLAPIREQVRAAVKDAINVAFGDTSRHRICKKAHAKTGVPPDQFRHLLEGDTQSLDFALAGIISHHYKLATGHHSPLVNLLLQVEAAE